MELFWIICGIVAFLSIVMSISQKKWENEAKTKRRMERRLFGANSETKPTVTTSTSRVPFSKPQETKRMSDDDEEEYDEYHHDETDIRDGETDWYDGDIDFTKSIIAKGDNLGAEYIVCCHFSLMGLEFRPGSIQYKASRLRCGEKLTLVPEPDNEHDEFAVKVCKGQSKLGYVPRRLSPSFQKNILKGNFVDCRVKHRKNDCGKVDVKLKAYFYDDGTIDGSNCDSLKIHQYYSEATEKKKEGKLKEAAKLFVFAGDTQDTGSPTNCYIQACTCYRQLKMYVEEKSLIEKTLEKHKNDMTDKQRETLTKKLETVKALLEKT